MRYIERMFKLPEIPTINLPTLPALDFPKFDLPNFNLPKFDFSKIDLPNIDFPAIDFSKLDVAALRNVTLPNVRDAAYMTVGLGVVAVERAQARGEQLAAIVNERMGKVRELIRSAV
jgi:hypothetical protein